MCDFGLCNVCRSHHPTLGDYTFSSVHHSQSHFLVRSSIMRDNADTQIHPVTINDHALVSISHTEKNHTPNQKLDI